MTTELKTIRINGADGPHLELHDYRDEQTAVTLPDLSGDDWRRTATEEASNGVDSLYVWHLPDCQLELYNEQGYPQSVVLSPRRSIADILLDYIPGDVLPEEYLTDWGCDPIEAGVLVKAESDWAGPCRVWHEPHYDPNFCNPPRASYATGRDDDDHSNDDSIREFASYDEAEAYVEDYYHAPSSYDGIPECKVLSYGQSRPDTLTIVETH